MTIKIYDYDNKVSEISIPDDKQIAEIMVHILSGDETGVIRFTDGSRLLFDASDNRLCGYEDGVYFVEGENIQKWIDFDVKSCSETISYARQGMFYDLED